MKYKVIHIMNISKGKVVTCRQIADYKVDLQEKVM